ncbi:cytochrome P450 [Macrophomina phaseolina]|uniref:Cytochrome P450 n=1 Tax=Macrophomina phaseolina TaxID=35725 RepID=A0ABQ8GJF6_9PEZI|nr:cytochrome P450 [Macrophomina phaseolina]
MNATPEAFIPHGAASPPAFLSLPAAACLGIAFHVVSQNFQLDDHGWRLLGGFGVLFWSSVAASAYYLGNGITTALLQVIPLATAALVGLYASIGVRRFFLSPLNKFPGPWQARLSKFYQMHLEAKNMQLMVEIHKLHEKYGDFVRTGPRQISVLRASAIPLFYGGKSPLQKSPFYRNNEFEDEETSLFNIINFQKHNKRRRVYDQGFSTKALNSYEPRVQNKVATALEKLGAFNGKPVNVTQWMCYFAFDVMGDVIFSKEYNLLKAGDGKIMANGVQTSLTQLQDGMKVLGYLGTIPWFLRMLTQAGISGDWGVMHEWCRGAMRDKQAKWERGSVPQGATSYLLKDFLEGESPSDRQTQQSLLQDSILLIIAGSDTTSSVAAHALYYLVQNPRVLATLQRQLDAAFPGGEHTVTNDAVRSQVPLVDHVVNETMRLKPSVGQGLQRVTPPEGITVDGVFIPGGTIVSVPTWSVQRDGRYWEEPEVWRPERWEGVDTREEALAFLPFSKGIFSCPGKTLAYMELRCLLSRIALKFDISFAPGEDGVKFEKWPMDTFTMTNQPLHLVFKERRRN